MVEEEDRIRQNLFDTRRRKSQKYFRRSYVPDCQPGKEGIVEGGINPNFEQHTFRGQCCLPGVPYCPHSAFALQSDVHPFPHSVGE